MRKLLGPIAAVALLLTLAMPVAAAPEDKVILCHATNSLDNPFSEIEISLAALEAGHKADNGEFHVNAKTGLQDFLLEGSGLETCDSVPDEPATPVAPAVSDATCEAPGTLTVTDVEGLDFTIDPAYTAGVSSGEFTVTYTAEEGFTIAEGATAEFTVNVPAQLVCVSGLAPGVSAGTCAAPGTLTLNAVTGIAYTVSPAYTAGVSSGAFTVTASATAGNTLIGNAVFVVNVPAKLVCNDGTLGGNPTPPPTPVVTGTPVRTGTQGSVPNTAMDAPTSELIPAALLALVALTGLGLLGHRNLTALRDRR